VSPRRNHPKSRSGSQGPERGGDFTFSGGSGDIVEDHPDGIFVVRKITGSSSNKPYRCPGCDQVIPTATPHTVAWLEHDVESRRHWHNACWAKRNNRGPRTERTRNAPRY